MSRNKSATKYLTIVLAIAGLIVAAPARAKTPGHVDYTVEFTLHSG